MKLFSGCGSKIFYFGPYGTSSTVAPPTGLAKHGGNNQRSRG